MLRNSIVEAIGVTGGILFPEMPERKENHMTEPLADIEIVKRLVVEAGETALRRWGTVVTEYKADSSLVTAVDRDIEQFLAAGLREHMPDYAFVGEEYGWRGERDVPVWACDPIDGTTNYICGLPHWCVSVGLLRDGIPELGVIYLPVLNELYTAERGKGAFCQTWRDGVASVVPLQVTDQDTLEQEDTVCLTSNALKSLPVANVPCRLRLFGSIATELAYTARGNLLATVGLHEGIVDVAAALCLGFEAGCEFRHLTGEAVSIAELLEKGRTDRHFLFGAPRLLTSLQNCLAETK